MSKALKKAIENFRKLNEYLDCPYKLEPKKIKTNIKPKKAIRRKASNETI